ncbi:MAG TPA: GNAT family N-acetyltransferase [Clostridiales bacterium]|nr:GNAT family N-acetyltransferase [Clostridiales bacterium]
MKIEIIPVKEEEKTILGHLLELYNYDFSEFEDSDVNALGLYGYSYLDCYWTDDRRYAYFIKVDGKLAGFVMVCDYCYVSKDKNTLFLSEFFVMRKYRRKGIGETAAKKVFLKHKGKWELTMHPENKGALRFWEKVVTEISGNTLKMHKNVDNVYPNSKAIAYTFEVN